MPSRSILERLGAGENLILDGGTGTELQKRGIDVRKGAGSPHLEGVPDVYSACLPTLRAVFDGPIGAYGHLGYDENPNFGKSPDEPYFAIDSLEYTPKRYAEFAREWREMGAQIIGGCCSTGPEHIAQLSAALGT